MDVGTVRIIEFDDLYANDFARLNYEWIENFFAVEEHDREMLDRPKEYIVDRGGQIFFALSGDAAAGTVALINVNDDWFEMAKMAVSPKFRGRGFADMLIERCLVYTRDAGKRGLFLLSNTRLGPAINLYRKHGFVETALDTELPYRRVDIRMELVIDRPG